MTGKKLRKKRNSKDLSQSKLADLTGINQAKISAYELGKSDLSKLEITTIESLLKNLNGDKISKLKEKRYRQHNYSNSPIKKRPRRSYDRTDRNLEYLDNLKLLANLFDKPARKGMKAVSFFAGCGGLCYGAKAAGFDIVYSNELIKDYREIYKANFKQADFLSNDIKDISSEELDIVIKKHGNIDLMIGGPPCQGFSLSGKRDVNDNRNTLFENYLSIAEHLKPKIMLMENVRLLTSMKDPDGELVKDRILRTFKEHGYNSDFFCVNSKNYGVPQSRERVFFIGVRKDISKKVNFPEPSFGKAVDLFNSKQPYFTFGDAVSDLHYIESGEEDDSDIHHKAVKHPVHVIKWLVDVPQGKSAHENADPNLRPPSGYNTTYKRQVWDEPAATISTTYGMISGSNNVHPIATRSLTTREALRIQSFPDNFEIFGKAGDVRTVIGNAVPPILAYKISEFIRDTYIL